MKITVTKKDLERGRRSSAWECPIGYACARTFNASYAFVGATVCLSNGLCIDLKEIGLEKITAFDKGEKVEPFEIRISAEAMYRAQKAQ